MPPTLLDFSRETALRLHAEIVGDFNAIAVPAGIQAIIVGAFARDLLLRFQYGINTLRSTEDVDLALVCENWNAYEHLRSKLLESNNFAPRGEAKHRLRHRSDISVDVVPFGGLETPDRQIEWPPGGDVVMDVFGFMEVRATALHVLLPNNVRTHVISLPALALLKLNCWRDRHYARPHKDAHDLHLIMRQYMSAGNEERLWEEFIEWTQEDSFDYESASARMLGHDMANTVALADWTKIIEILTEQCGAEELGPMPKEMNPYDPPRARTLLSALLRGIKEHIDPEEST
jgi:predicted nucleotidyltransferase